MRVILFLAAFLSLSIGAAAGPIFAGCGTLGVLGNVLTGVLGTVSNLLATLLTSEDCQARCKSLGRKYSLFSLGLSTTLNTYNKNTLLGSCWCNNEGLQPASVTQGADSQGTCQTFLVGLIGVKVDYVGDNRLTFKGCKASVGFTPSTDVVSFEVSTKDQCFTSSRCAGKQNIAVRSAKVKEEASLVGGLLELLLGTTGGTYECMCSNGAISGSSIVCETRTDRQYVSRGLVSRGLVGGLLGGSHYLNTYAYHTFSQDVPTAALGRRKLRMARHAENIYCPRGLTACSIPGTEEYECLDVSSDLESCGGCISGQFGVNGTTTGLDCASLPNAARGYVSCVEGRCVASKCKPGRKLRDGLCW